MKQVIGEFEMYMGDTDNEFNKLQSVIDRFEDNGYKTYCNRLLAEKTINAFMADNPVVELAFLKI